MNAERTTIYLPDEVIAKLRDYAYTESKRLGKRVTYAEFIRNAVKEKLSRMEEKRL